LKEIESQLNKTLNGQIYDDSNLADDKTEMKIWKTAPIKLVEKNGKIQTIMPLKIWAKFKYGTDFMGLNDTREINLNGTITMVSDVKLSNWKLSTTSKIEDFEWTESPTILVAGKYVPITYIINPTLSIFKSKSPVTSVPKREFTAFVVEVIAGKNKSNSDLLALEIFVPSIENCLPKSLSMIFLDASPAMPALLAYSAKTEL
jgi:hypothetical protein